MAFGISTTNAVILFAIVVLLIATAMFFSGFIIAKSEYQQKTPAPGTQQAKSSTSPSEIYLVQFTKSSGTSPLYPMSLQLTSTSGGNTVYAPSPTWLSSLLSLNNNATVATMVELQNAIASTDNPPAIKPLTPGGSSAVYYFVATPGGANYNICTGEISANSNPVCVPNTQYTGTISPTGILLYGPKTDCAFPYLLFDTTAENATCQVTAVETNSATGGAQTTNALVPCAYPWNFQNQFNVKWSSTD